MREPVGLKSSFFINAVLICMYAAILSIFLIGLYGLYERGLF